MLGGCLFVEGVTLGLGCARIPSGSVEASQSVYVRTDSDRTTVVSPRTRLTGTVGDDVSVNAAYTVDVWTGASVDVVTAATRAIHEQRHEIQGGAGYQHGGASVDGTYRYSTEPDYESHSGVLRGALELFQKNTVLAVTAFGGRDTVGRAGDPWFRQLQWNLGAKGAVTQVLSKRAIGEVSWETTTVNGFQSSPYRWVAIGGQGVCAGSAPFCVPEHVPGERVRNAATVTLRHAGPAGLSFGGRYRFYFDSWGITSQTIEPDVAVSVGYDGDLSLRYRFYTQGEATFYRPRYFELDKVDYVTRDRKLSALYSHMLSVAYTHHFSWSRSSFSLGVQASGTFISYLAFVGLEQVRALELTALLGMKLDDLTPFGVGQR